MQRAGQGVLRVIWVLVACSVATSRQAEVSQAVRKERGEVCSTVHRYVLCIGGRITTQHKYRIKGVVLSP